MNPFDCFTRAHATISECGLYRYTLTRGWSVGSSVTFVMLNPSTADGLTDDATIRRCIGFARREGHGSMHVVNLFALRSTWPGELVRAADPVGPENLRHVAATLAASASVIVAWGAHPFAMRQEQWMLDCIRAYHLVPMCFGIANNGAPLHPLRLRRDTPLIPFPIPEKIR
ncbi:MAG: DUF1643 domain-containing protein [Phycisphaerales bacterium]|nr:DUF1643 domain-containing protein [Phycisphaerales bacterium]